jgi:sugar phosphate isomerase/epimerase
MKLSLNGAGLSAGHLSFLEFAELAARHQFDGFDFGTGGAAKAAEALGGMTALNERLLALGVTPSVFGLDVDWRGDDAAFRAGIERLPGQAAIAQQLGVTRCCTYLLPATNFEPIEWRKAVIRRFAEIASILSDYGVRFGLEWVGPHHLRTGGENATGQYKFIETMPETLALINEIGAENVGLLVDSYHCYTTNVTEAELAALSDAQIVHVHINDAKIGVGPAGARDGDRVLPGVGEIDLAAFLRGVSASNYSGYVSCEVLAPTPIASNAEEAAAAVRASLHSVGL